MRTLAIVLTACFLVAGAGPDRADTVTRHIYCCTFSFKSPGQPVVNNITVNAEDTVQWMWDHTTPDHSTTSVTGLAETWDAGIHGGPFTHNGAYPVYCRVHGGVTNGMVFGMSGSVTVQAPPVLTNVKLLHPSITGCLTDQLTLTISGPAPTAGQTVTLTNTNPAATVPATIVIPAGSATVKAPIMTQPVAATKSGVITATANGSMMSATLKVLPDSVRVITLAPNPVVGGNVANGSVQLYCPAPVDMRVALGSSNLAVAAPYVPSFVIQAGQTTHAITVETSAPSTQARVVIRATTNGLTRSKTLIVNP